jgi:hypothetical protein
MGFFDPPNCLKTSVVTPTGVTMFEDYQQQYTIWVIPCNCRLVHGAGLAKAAAKKWGDAFTKREPGSQPRPGDLYRWCVLTYGEVHAAFTKGDWRKPSELAWIEEIVKALPEFADIVSGDCAPFEVRVPKLGCGLGGLNWADVEPIYKQYLSDSPHRFIIY